MTIDTQEALRLFDKALECARRNDPSGTYKHRADLFALLSAKDGEPIAANWRQAIHEFFDQRNVPHMYRDDVVLRAIALRDAEKEKGNG